MNDFNEEQYAAAIPAVCSMDFKGHMEIMLCWGLCSSLAHGKEMECGDCEFRKRLPCISCGAPESKPGQLPCGH